MISRNSLVGIISLSLGTSGVASGAESTLRAASSNEYTHAFEAKGGHHQTTKKRSPKHRSKHMRHQRPSCTGATNCALSINDGLLSSSCSALAGAFYTYSDGAGSTIEPSFEPALACATGSVAQVLNDEWGVYWGAGLGVTLIDPNQADDTGYNAQAESVQGFGFTLDGFPAEGQLRLQLTDADDERAYCTPSGLQAGHNEVRFEDLLKECWVPVEGTFDASTVTNIQWHVVTNNAYGYDYAFCVSDITTLR